VDYKKILELIREMNRSDLTKIEIEEEGFRIRLEKETNVQGTGVHSDIQCNNTDIPASGTCLQPPGIEGNKADEYTAGEPEGIKVLSPMVGTFYAQAAPDKPPFVKIGDKVKKGQTLCIIEAMKLMNEIESEYDGEIVKVCINNEEMVEFGQPLFVIQ
jgi:acetyl-CoA carboxylase biotin carboxyl carrier protein